jgi:hypothetical protein
VYGVASYSGFIENEGSNIFKEEPGNASKELKEKNFFESFNQIISNKDLIPDKTVILLNQEKHHIKRSKRKPSTPLSNKNKKFKSTGTKPITDYFEVKKRSTSNEKKSPEPFFKYQAEEIVHKLRGDSVKILWIPEKHSELDALAYVHISLRYEICNFMEINQEETTQAAISHNLDIFPDLAWTRINEQIQFFEKIYLERNEDAEFDQDEEDEESNDNSISTNS